MAKKHIISISLVIISIIQWTQIRLFSQTSENSLQKVYRYCYAIKSIEWYKNQSELWKKEIVKNSKSEDSWYNYYFACRYANLGIDGKIRRILLDSIADEIEKTIPDSYLSPYVKYYNGDHKIEYLERAYKIKPTCSDIFWEYIQFYETEGNKIKMKEFCKKLYSSKEINSGLFDYSYNILTSLDSNAILMTNGDNDTYPLWILQKAKNIRNDVMVVNAHALFVLRDYLKMKLKEKGVEIDFSALPDENGDIAFFIKTIISSIKGRYPEISINFVPSMDYETIKEVVKNLYNTGLIFNYSEKQIENISYIRKNLEEKFRLNYLELDWYNENHISQTIMNEINLNYIPAFMELYKMYASFGNKEKANFWKNMAILLATNGSDKETLLRIESE